MLISICRGHANGLFEMRGRFTSQKEFNFRTENCFYIVFQDTMLHKCTIDQCFVMAPMCVCFWELWHQLKRKTENALQEIYSCLFILDFHILRKKQYCLHCILPNANLQPRCTYIWMRIQVRIRNTLTRTHSMVLFDLLQELYVLTATLFTHKWSTIKIDWQSQCFLFLLFPRR